MPSNLETNVRVKLLDMGTTLEELWSQKQSVKETHQAVQNLTGLIVSERSVRRWLDK